MSYMLYNEDYYENHMKRGKLTLSNKALIKLILKESACKQNLLEIGCAKGEVLRCLEPHFDNLTGVDISEYAISQANEILKKTKLIQCDVEKNLLLDCVPNRYDVIVSLHVFEHLIDPKAALTDVYSLLEEKGYFYLVVPNPDVIWGKFLDIFNLKYKCAVFSDSTHVSLYSKDEWEMIIQGTGFIVKEFVGRPFFAIKNRFLDKFYPNYYYKFLAKTGYELLFICSKK